MKDREMIARLRDLRRRREDRAREEVIRRHAAVDRAARKGREAAGAVTEHLQRTIDAEDAAFGSLVGHPIKAASLHRLQARFEIAARKTAQLRENEKMAGVVDQQRKAELSEARNDHRATMKAVTKLDRLLEHLTKRTARRCLALAELSEEEERGPARLPTER
ncbi:YscO family type III secretion system apparatus protein [Mesorhizobium sp. M0622]|uniref:type III secretion system stalk subunit SctO n=1 Tax=Mesorhizobium sp. M0622 TaxID=2956975 RepID=UPI00333B386E